MNKNKIYSLLSATLLISGTVVAQEKDKNKKDDNIGTEVVNVVRAYDATISDAFKVRELPNLDDEADIKKKPIKYTINSFPVASTFVPEKGQAAAVEKDARLETFDNYVLFGIGNYLNLRGELFLTGRVNETDYITGFANHFSSNGGIKDLLLDDTFSTSKAEITYQSQKEKWNWSLDLGGKHQVANWYGLPVNEYAFTSNILDGIDEKQVYKTAYVGGKAAFSNAPITSLEFQYKHFWDAHDSKENRFFFRPNFNTALEIGDLNVGLIVDYVGTDYENFALKERTSYSHLNFGVEPTMKFQGDDYSFTAGVGVFFNNGDVAGKSKNSFYIYPKVKASFNLVNDIVVTYMGAEGGLKQNSYADFVSENPFISPNVMIAPTNEQYDLYIGLKGKLDNSISYNVRGSLKNEDDKAFFLTNPFSAVLNTNNGYTLGNSLGVVYNNLKTYSVFGELRFDFEKNVSMGVYGEFNHYTTDLTEAWNMPKSKFGADIQIDLTDRWFAGTEIHYIGERKDMYTRNYVNNIDETAVKTLDAYADLNVKVGYRPTKNWTLFLHGNNLLNKNNEHWMNFKTQGIQVLGGAMYKFDF